MPPDFLASELDHCDPERSFFHVIPVPMEASVSYGGGTALGPAAILEASQQLEAWDGRSLPLERGIHTTAPVDCSGTGETVLDRITARTEETLAMGALPVALGGEHALTLGLLRALKRRGDFGIVQFDAHADLRDEYEGNPFSHACVMRRAIDELGLPVFQLGVRALCREEHLFRSRAGVGFLDARTLYERGIPDELLPRDFPERIYISFDVDGLDPSVIRATGTPVPGGLSWHDSLTLVEKAVSGRTVVGFDVVELAPSSGDHASDFAAAQLVYAIMGIVHRGRQ
ncbi:MAG TPA: agmatinase [Desulfobacteraceae bacterium]|nr:agmatinase [Desulfobacteraceae bacterium]